MTTDFLPEQIVELPGRISVPSLPDFSTDFVTDDLARTVRTGRRRLARVVPWMSSGPSTRTRVLTGVAVLGAAAAAVWWFRRRDTAGDQGEQAAPTWHAGVRAA